MIVGIDTQRVWNIPWKNCTPIIPKVSRVRKKRSKMLSMAGIEFKMVRTRPRIPYKEFNVRSGLKILITLMEATLLEFIANEKQPIITTKKSRILSGSLRYE